MHLVEMENFFILGSGGIISAVGLKMGIDYPAGNYMFAPLGVIGVATMVFGVLQSVPFLPESARVVVWPDELPRISRMMKRSAAMPVQPRHGSLPSGKRSSQVGTRGPWARSGRPSFWSAPRPPDARPARGQCERARRGAARQGPEHM